MVCWIDVICLQKCEQWPASPNGLHVFTGRRTTPGDLLLFDISMKTTTYCRHITHLIPDEEIMQTHKYRRNSTSSALATRIYAFNVASQYK